MKLLYTLSALIFLSIFCANAQTKEEKELKKEWSKKMKEMDPLEFKKLVEEKEALKAEVETKTTTVTNQEAKLKEKDEEFAKLTEEFENYKKSVQTATTPVGNETDATLTNQKKEALVNGVVFKVQIGAFRNRDLTKYFENNKNFSGEVDTDGIKKYTLGYFNDYWQADNFKKYLREMGVKDAWIVPYKNGQRMSIKDVLEGAI